MTFPEQYRLMSGCPKGYESNPSEPFGMFLLKDGQRPLLIIACDGAETGWEHVSVSLPAQKDKCPSWPEMCRVKELFWSANETVIQFHPAKTNYVNFHGGCLHLWRYCHGTFPLPDPILVGPTP